jgi:hypothetical protein
MKEKKENKEEIEPKKNHTQKKMLFFALCFTMGEAHWWGTFSK